MYMHVCLSMNVTLSFEFAVARGIMTLISIVTFWKRAANSVNHKFSLYFDYL